MLKKWIIATILFTFQLYLSVNANPSEPMYLQPLPPEEKAITGSMYRIYGVSLD